MASVCETGVLGSADGRGQDPEGEDAESGAEGEVNERKDREDDGEDSAPGLASDEGIAGERSAGNAEDQRCKCEGPESSEECTVEGAPAEVEVAIGEVVAEYAVQEEHADEAGECTQGCVDEPENAKCL